MFNSYIFQDTDMQNKDAICNELNTTKIEKNHLYSQIKQNNHQYDLLRYLVIFTLKQSNG